jgi:hypothetical protein
MRLGRSANGASVPIQVTLDPLLACRMRDSTPAHVEPVKSSAFRLSGCLLRWVIDGYVSAAGMWCCDGGFAWLRG